MFIAIIYVTILYGLTGSFFSRVHAIVQNNYVNPCRYDLLPIAETIKRITYQLPLLLIEKSMALSFIFILPLFWLHVKKRIILSPKVLFYSTCFFILFVTANFMSTSLSAYVPMCLDPRHYLFLTPLACLPAAYGLQLFVTTQSARKPFVFIAALVAIIALLFGYESAYRKYIPLFAVMLLGLFSNFSTYKNRLLYVFLLALILLAETLFLFNNKQVKQYAFEKQIVEKYFLNHSTKNALVVTDEVQARLGQYHLKFDTSRVKFTTYNNYPQLSSDKPIRVYVLNNDFTKFLCSSPPVQIAPLLSDSILYDASGVLLFKRADNSR